MFLQQQPEYEAALHNMAMRICEEKQVSSTCCMKEGNLMSIACDSESVISGQPTMVPHNGALPAAQDATHWLPLEIWIAWNASLTARIELPKRNNKVFTLETRSSVGDRSFDRTSMHAWTHA